MAEHQLRGTFRPARHGHLEHLTTAAAVAVVVKPPWLSTGAASIWDELAPLAMTLGTLTASDATAFGVLVELLHTGRLASAQKAESGSAITLERRTVAAVKPWLEMFGLAGPASRARLRVPLAADAPVNPLEKYLHRTPPKWPSLA